MTNNLVGSFYSLTLKFTVFQLLQSYLVFKICMVLNKNIESAVRAVLKFMTAKKYKSILRGISNTICLPSRYSGALTSVMAGF